MWNTPSVQLSTMPLLCFSSVIYYAAGIYYTSQSLKSTNSSTSGFFYTDRTNDCFPPEFSSCILKDGRARSEISRWKPTQINVSYHLSIFTMRTGKYFFIFNSMWRNIFLHWENGPIHKNPYHYTLVNICRACFLCLQKYTIRPILSGTYIVL